MASDPRRMQRAIDQIREQLSRVEVALEGKAAASELESLRAQLGAIEDRDSDGLPDSITLDGGTP